MEKKTFLGMLKDKLSQKYESKIEDIPVEAEKPDISLTLKDSKLTATLKDSKLTATDPSQSAQEFLELMMKQYLADEKERQLDKMNVGQIRTSGAPLTPSQNANVPVLEILDDMMMTAQIKQTPPAGHTTNTVLVQSGTTTTTITDADPQSVFEAHERLVISSIKSKISMLSVVEAISPIMSSYRGLVIAGGVFSSIFHHEDPNDIDVFVLDQGDHGPLYTVLRMENNFEETTKNNTVYAANTHIRHLFTRKDAKVQFIFTKFATIKDLLDDFDFKHCRVAYDGNKLYISRSAYNAMRDKKLVLHNPNRSQNQFQLQKRVRKFLDRGYKEGATV